MGIKPQVFFILTILLLITSTSCTPESATVSSPTSIVSSTEKPDTATPTDVSTPPPKVPDTIHLRVEFQTTSDWSDLSILSPEIIRGVNLLFVEGDPLDYELTPERVSISQPSALSEKGNKIGVTYDLQLDPRAHDNPQFVLIERGDLNTSMVKIYHVHNDELFLLQEIIHNRMVLDQLGRNPYNFVLDLSGIQDQMDD